MIAAFAEPRVQRRLASRVRQPETIGLPTMVLCELEVGIAKPTSPEKRKAQLNDMLRVLNLLPFDRAAAEASARIRAELEAQGQPIAPVDTLIAGTAMAAPGAALVSHNRNEFGRVQGLQVVDWF